MDALLYEFFDGYFKLDRQGRVQAIQQKSPSLFSNGEGDLTGKILWEALPQLKGGDLDQKIRAAVAAGKILRVSGPLLPGKGWLEITIRPVDDGVECYVRDISAYRQTQPSTTQDENSRIIFDALLEFIPEGIIIADAAAPPGKYPFLVSSRYAAWILGISREVLNTSTLEDLLGRVSFYEPGSDTPLSLEKHPLTRFIEHGESSSDLEYELLNTRGERRPVSVKGGPIRNQDGRIIAGIFSWMDITERKTHEHSLEQNARKLEQSNRDLESFAYAASHDLQEPLRKVRGFSDMLEKKYRPVIDEEGQEILLRIHSAAVRMQSLMNDLLEFSLINSKDLEQRAVDLNEVLSAVQLDLDLTISSSQGRVEVDPLPVVYANKARMQQLFLNLVGNGLKFHGDEPPRVRVFDAGQVVREGRPWARIAVEDNGIGFDDSKLDIILQPFQRLHGRSQYEGSGIGLAISRRIVEQLGGEITATSTPGQGSTFVVTLPLTIDLSEDDFARQ